MKQRPIANLLSLVWVFSLSVVACQPIQAGSMAQAAKSANEEDNRVIVQRFYDEVFTGKDMDVLAEVFDPELVIHDLDVGGELPGGGLEGTLAAFPDVVATINLWVVEGDLVTTYVTYNATHQAEFLGVPATGKSVTWSIIDIWRVRDGKIVELWHNIPNEDILEQIDGTVDSAQ